MLVCLCVFEKLKQNWLHNRAIKAFILKLLTIKHKPQLGCNVFLKHSMKLIVTLSPVWEGIQLV